MKSILSVLIGFKRYFLSLVFLLFAINCVAKSIEKSIPIQFQWEYSKVSSKIELYELANDSNAPLWKTESVSSFAKVPAGDLIKDGKIELSLGQKKKFLLVYRNSTNKVEHFFAAPHSATPAEASLGFKFKCLCVNHAFKVQAKGIWYRVVEFRLAPKFIGENLTITHNIVGLESDKAEEFNRSMKSMDHHGDD